MRLVLDLQGAQSHSRRRGIGRYTLSMARAFAQQAAGHELWLVLNGREDETSTALVHEFAAWVPRERIVIDALPAGIAGREPGNWQRMKRAEAAQSALLSRLDADCIWHSSLFEGWGDDFVAALGSGVDDHRRAATLYDLIPLRHPERHLRDPAYARWYYRRLGYLKRCGLLLALSESTKRDALLHLQLDDQAICVVHGAADPVFKPLDVDDNLRFQWKRSWGLQREFVLYVGGYDAHKNVDALIAAYAELPWTLRQRHQLVLAGRCEQLALARLQSLIDDRRLAAGEVLFTGDVSDQDLIGLYSSCKLFVAPSLCEGLGLPVLEAMACAAPVIAANTASFPETIGRADALFDPRSGSSMQAKLHASLTDAGFLAQLRQHAREQTRKFTWKVSAGMALRAIEQRMGPAAKGPRWKTPRPRLAVVSPLPPMHSGVADYTARILRELASHYDIDVVVQQSTVVEPWILGNFPIRSVSWFKQHAHRYSRVLYHLGNSPFHAHMLDMLERYPGVVMLHDGMLAGLRNWMASDSGDLRRFLCQLYRSHGYRALLDDRQRGRQFTLDAYPMSLDVIEDGLGVIVHSRHSLERACHFYGSSLEQRFRVVPFPREQVARARRAARRMLGLDPDDFVVCSFGMLAPTKLNHMLLDAWLQSDLRDDRRCCLMFVGENEGGDYGHELQSVIARHRGRTRIKITGHVAPDRYDDYLAAADIAVQLRTSSRGETSAAVFDALANGLPLITNAHGSAAELPDDVTVRLADSFAPAQLARALEQLHADPAQRERLATSARNLVSTQHHPAEVARHYRDAIEYFSTVTSRAEELRMARRIELDERQISAEGMDRSDDWRRACAVNRQRFGLPTIFVDVTSTSGSDLYSGIERVVRGVLLELLKLDQRDWRIEPVRIQDGCFVRASDYALHLLDHVDIGLPEEALQPRLGDIFLGLDWVADALPANTALLQAWRARGVRMLFVVYDLLPVRMPHWFPQGIAAMHADWLQCIGRHADALLGISRAVAADLHDWYDANPPGRQHDLPLGFFYPGSDTDATHPSAGLPADASDVLARIKAFPSVLMLGTVEPRKGHAFALDAFERLWAKGVKGNLVIVGSRGWMSDALIARMHEHAQWGTHLIWLEHVSDEYLHRITDTVIAMLAASEGEGFGLPLVEAAQRGMPVIARDIPVFREVASSFAQFFASGDVPGLAALLHRTMQTRRGEPAAATASVISWKATTDTLWDMLFDASHPQWLCSWRQRAGTHLDAG